MAKQPPRTSVTKISGSRRSYRVTTTSGRNASTHSQSSKVVKGESRANRVAARQNAHHQRRQAAGVTEW